MRILLLPTLAALVLALLPARDPAVLVSAPGPDPVPRSGLRLELESLRGGARDVRLARLVALWVEAGTPPSPYLPPGPFKARWVGHLNLDIRTRLAFSVVGRGKVRLTVKDQVLLEGESDDLSTLSMEMERIRKGANPLVFEYESPADGSGHVRLLWRGRDFVAEPVPPAALTHDQDDALDRQTASRKGREVFAHRRCIQCHRPEAPLPQDAMPELFADAPRWRDPSPLAPGTTTFDSQAVKRGGTTFAHLGCVACHPRPGHSKDDDARGSLSLDRVPVRFDHESLAAYLEKPDASYAWARMPDFNLEPEEAKNLAAFLLSEARPGDEDAATQRDCPLVRGEQGCAACHDGAPYDRLAAPSFESLAKTDWTKAGCVASDRGDAPDLGLAAEERAALLALGPPGMASLERRSLAEFADRQIDSLQCGACHVVDGRQDRWSSVVTETSDLEPPLALEPGKQRISQERPELTWLGEKLHVDWTTAYLAGDLPRMRPWLDGRMPAFPSRAALLARGLSERHGFGPDTRSPPKPNGDLVEPGELLVGKDGFGCTACHDLMGTPAYARFEVGAIDFRYTSSRLREPYFHRWMWNPLRVHASSRMPIYAASVEDGITLQDEILEGDAHRQFAAIWAYLQSIHGR